MPYIDSNIPQNIFYSAIKRQFLRIARSSFCLNNFIPKVRKDIYKCYVLKETKLISLLKRHISTTQKIQPKILNLSKFPLRDVHVNLLSKRPKFCPTTKGSNLNLKSDFKEFTRKLKCLEKFWILNLKITAY